MRIAPITNNRINNNISNKGKYSFVALRICVSQKNMWNREIGVVRKPEELRNFLGCLIDDKYLAPDCKNLFEGKNTSQIIEIREKYRKQAEDNFNMLTKIIHEKFSEYVTFHIRKANDETKPHAVLNSSATNYTHDFGEVELSERHNNLSDIDSITKLVEQISALSDSEIKAINEKMAPPVTNSCNNNDDDTAAAIICMIAGGL